MAWNVIRKATETDNARLDAAAARFIKRHHLGLIASTVSDVECYLSGGKTGSIQHEMKAKRIAPLWRRAVRRALSSETATGIAYGTVGHN